MTLEDPVAMLAGAPLLVIVPALVEVAKAIGLPTRFAGIGAIALATILFALGDLALGTAPGDAGQVIVARWMIGGIVYGLAAAGLYTQRILVRDRAAEA